LESLKSLPE